MRYGGQLHHKIQCLNFGCKISDLFDYLILFCWGGEWIINRKSGLDLQLFDALITTHDCVSATQIPERCVNTVARHGLTFEIMSASVYKTLNVVVCEKVCLLFSQ